MTNTSDQIIPVDKSNEAYTAAWFHLESLLQAPTWRGISKWVLFAGATCGNCRSSKLSSWGLHGIYTPTHIRPYWSLKPYFILATAVCLKTFTPMLCCQTDLLHIYCISFNKLLQIVSVWKINGKDSSDSGMHHCVCFKLSEKRLPVSHIASLEVSSLLLIDVSIYQFKLVTFLQTWQPHNTSSGPQSKSVELGSEICASLSIRVWFQDVWSWNWNWWLRRSSRAVESLYTEPEFMGKASTLVGQGLRLSSNYSAKAMSP